MSEADVIAHTPTPLTFSRLCEQFRALGLSTGRTVLVHSAMSRMGWIAGGPETVIRALLAVVGPQGTLMMPTHTGGNTDPSFWQNPPVPESWWPLIIAETPPFDPATTPSREMGVIAELFRTWPGAIRSQHPLYSFAALGPQAQTLLADHRLETGLGEGSPLSKLYDLDGDVLLLGVGHDNNTSLHLAEYRAEWPRKATAWNSLAMSVDGERQWVRHESLDINSDDFDVLGRDYEAAYPVAVSKVGLAEVRLFKQRPIVDFAVEWIQSHR